MSDDKSYIFNTLIPTLVDLAKPFQPYGSTRMKDALQMAFTSTAAELAGVQDDLKNRNLPITNEIYVGAYDKLPRDVRVTLSKVFAGGNPNKPILPSQCELDQARENIERVSRANHNFETANKILMGVIAVATLAVSPYYWNSYVPLVGGVAYGLGLLSLHGIAHRLGYPEQEKKNNKIISDAYETERRNRNFLNKLTRDPEELTKFLVRQARQKQATNTARS